MKLYVLPGSCALACHIALEWAGAEYELEVLTRDALRSERYASVNPKAKVRARVGARWGRGDHGSPGRPPLDRRLIP